MTLTDPRDALAEQSTFIGYLMGLASLGQVVRELADGPKRRSDDSCEADDFIHLLVGFASVGAAVDKLGENVRPERVPGNPMAEHESPIRRWLR
jgi:uncharacterized protein YcbX